MTGFMKMHLLEGMDGFRSPAWILKVVLLLSGVLLDAQSGKSQY